MLRKARCAGSLKKLLGTPEERVRQKKHWKHVKGGVDKKGDNPTKTKGSIIVSNSFYWLQGVVPSLNSLFGFAGGASTFHTTGPSTNQPTF